MVVVAAGTTEVDQEDLDPTLRVVEGGQTVSDGNKMVLNMIGRVPAMVMITEGMDQITTVGVDTAEEVIRIITTGIVKVVLVGGAPEVETILDREVEVEVVVKNFPRGAKAVRGNIHRGPALVRGIISHREAVVEIIFHHEVEATMDHLVVGRENAVDHVVLADPAVEVRMILGVMAAVIIALPQVEVVTSVHEVQVTARMLALPVGPLAGVDHVEAPMGGVEVGRDPRATVKLLA